MKALWSTVWTAALVLSSSVLAIFMSNIALGVGPVSTAWPRFGIIVVFFWMLHRPGTMTLLLIFILGLVQDLILGDIPGAGVLALLITAIALDRMLLSLRTMPLVWRWLGFGAFVGIVFAIEWILTSAARLALQPLDLVVMQCGTTFLVYPAISVAMRQILRIGRTPRRAL